MRIPKKREDGRSSRELRPYQKTNVRNILRALTEVRRVLFVEVMGAGKTVTVAEVVRRLVEQGSRVLILVHRGELLKQSCTRLVEWGVPADKIGRVWAEDAGINLDAPVQVATVQTIAARKFALVGVTHVVIDEAHHVAANSWSNIVGWYPSARILGLTATPERLDGEPLGPYFDKLVEGEMTSNLIDAGYIVKPETWTLSESELPRMKRTVRRGKDWTAAEAERAVAKSKILKGSASVREWKKRNLLGSPTVLFAAVTEQAEMFAEKFRRAGVPAETLLHTHTEKERSEKLARLRSGKTRVLCTCHVLGEGWDEDQIRCVILARPTCSLALYMQMVGRAMRRGEPSVVLDLAGNWRWMGAAAWEDHEWSLTEKKSRESKYVARIVEGRVVYEPPREVRGKLVRADHHVLQQTVCAGFDGQPCPNREIVPRNACRPSRMRRREGRPWLCRKCRYIDSEWLKPIREAGRRRSQNPEWLRKITEANRRRSQDPEWLRKITEANRQTSKDSEWRTKVRENLLLVAKNPESRRKQREGTRRRYEGNPEWVSRSANTRKSCRYLVHLGHRLTVAQWSKRIGLGSSTIRERLRRGWSIDRTLSTPVTKPVARR